MNEEMIQRIMGCPSLPSLPAVAMRVLELTQRPDVSMDELARTIHNDQALTAKVLKTVNSSFYGLRRRCTTINGALVMLGLSTVKTLSLGFSLLSTVNDAADGEFELAPYWRRGLYGAVAAKRFADACGLRAPDEAFLGGLLQDIGMMAMYRTLGKRYLRVLPLAGGVHRRLAAVEMAELGVQHPHVGAMLGERWKLPAELLASIRHHEQPSKAAGAHAGLVRCVAAGNLVHDVLTDRDPSAALRRLHESARAWFELAPSEAEEILRRSSSATRELSSLFRLDTGADTRVEEVLERAQRQLKKLARTPNTAAGYDTTLESLVSDGDVEDPLTGSLGRTELLRQSEELFTAAVSGGLPIAAISVFLDGFAALVEARGSEAGDTVLVSTAALLLEHFEASGGIVGRSGDASFTLVLPRTCREEAVEAAEQIRQSLATAAKNWGLDPSGLTVSVGAAALDRAIATSTVDRLLLESARAMETAAASGGNCVRTFLPRVAA